MKNICLFISWISISCPLTTILGQTINSHLSKSLTEYKIRNWTTDDGLASNTLLRLYQDKAGYLWISSYDGLTRFDGSKFITYTKSNGLPSSQVQAMIDDSSGNLWIGTGAGLVKYSAGEFIRLENAFDLVIQTLWIDESKHSLLIGTRGQGLFTYDIEARRCEKIESPYDKDIIRAAIKDDRGRIWAGSERAGLSYYLNGHWEKFSEKDGLPNHEINCLYQNENGSLYVGTNTGLYLYDGLRFTRLPEFINKLVNGIIKDNLGNLWILTSSGLFKQNADGLLETLNTSNGLSNNSVQDILFDSEGSIWLATYRGGLQQLSESKFLSYSTTNGLATDEISAIKQLSEDKFILGSMDGKIMLIDHGSATTMKIKTPMTERVHDFLLDKNNNLWVATHTGLLLIKPDGQERLFNKKDGLLASQIWVITQDRKNNYWLGSRTGGLIKMDFITYPDKPVFSEYQKEKINASFIMSIKENNQGDLLLGTNTGGLNVITSSGDIKIYRKAEGLNSNVVFSTYTDAEGITWLATTEGLSCMVGDTFFNYTYAEGLPFESIMDVIEDGQGYLWMPTGIGIVRAKKQELIDFSKGKIKTISWKLFDRNDGMKKSQCTGASHSLKARNGHIWFPTFGGIVSVDPKTIATNTVPPRVYIEKVTVDDKAVDLTKSMVLPPGNHRIVFHYTALSLLYPMSPKYRYRIENFDLGWVEAGGERQAVYTNLKQGSYSFQVLGANNDNVWNTTGATIGFRVEPYFFQTRWFYTLSFCGFIFIVFGYSRWRTNSIKKKSELLENEVEKRTQELVEKTNEIAHKNESLQEQNTEITGMINIVAHDLRAPLNKISGLLFLLGKSGELNPEQKEYVQYIDRVTKHGNYLIRDLLDVHSFEYEDSKPNYSEIKISEFMDEWKKAMTGELQRKKQQLRDKIEIADAIFHCDPIFLTRILDNLLTNASKFSEKGTNVYVTVFQNTHLLSFSVRDEGPGIDESDQKKMFRRFQKLSARPTDGESSNGLGLSIIKTLTEKLNGKISVKSQVGVGTEFIVTLPLAPPVPNS